MPVRIKVNATAAAIYSGTDDAPFTAPLSNLSRLFFHSDLPMVGIVEIVTGTKAAGSSEVLFAHGLPYTPMVFGTAYVPTPPSGYTRKTTPQTVCGTTPLVKNPSGMFQPFYGAVTLASDATNVLLYKMSTYETDFAIQWTVYVTNVALAGTAPAQGSRQLEITSSTFSVGRNSIKSGDRYLYENAAGQFFLPRGKTINMHTAGTTNNVGGYYNADGFQVTLGDGGPAFTAAIEKVSY